MRSNLHLNATPMNAITESRTGRSVEALLDGEIFNKITIACTSTEGNSVYAYPGVTVVEHRRDYDVEAAGLFRKTYFTIKWCIRVYKDLSMNKYTCINCHSINLLPLAVILKLKMRAILIYDIHELETETKDLSFLRKYVSKVVEFLLIRFADFTIVVSEPIKNWYKTRYSLKDIGVIRNMPSVKESKVELPLSLREVFNIPDEEIVFVYHGALVEGRGIKILLEAFVELKDSGRNLVIVGFGSLRDFCKQLSEKHKNIYFYEAMKKDELLEFIKGADIGLNFIDRSCLNHEYCLPNKLWDYLSIPLPVMVNNLEGMKSVVEEYDCGWLVEDQKEIIKDAVIDIEVSEIAVKKKNALKSLSKWGWSQEREKLISIYADLLIKKKLWQREK